MENTLKYERHVALEVQEKLELEIANKNSEVTQLGCELEKWKSAAETFKAFSEEIQGKCQKVESNLISKVGSEEALKNENETLIRIAREQKRKAEELQEQIAFLELSKTSKLKEAEIFEQEKEKLELEVANKNDEITLLGCELEKWKSTAETLKASSDEIQVKCHKMESSLILQVESDQALKDENERLICIVKEQERKAEELQKQIAFLELYYTSKLKEAERSIKEDKNQIIKHLKELALSLEQDLMCALPLASSERVEKWVEVAVLTGALKDAENLVKLEIEEKNVRIGKSKEEIDNLHEKLAYKEESI